MATIISAVRARTYSDKADELETRARVQRDRARRTRGAVLARLYLTDALRTEHHAARLRKAAERLAA